MFEETEYSEEHFENVDFKSGSMRNKEFYDCQFTQCKFNDAQISFCKFIDCTFTDCDLSNTTITGSRFRELSSQNSKWLGVNWTTAESVSHLVFTNCVLNYNNFLGTDLRKSKFENCLAREADFRQANLTEAVLRGTDFMGAVFANTNLTKADFRQAINYSVRPNENTLKMAKFSLPEAHALLLGLDIILDD